MPIHDPSESHRVWSDAFNRGDLEGMLALYEPDAIMVPEPGEQVTGTEALRAALEGFLAVKGTVSIETHSVVVVNDIALTRGNWTLQGTGADGKPLEMGGENAEVLRRQPDGTWLVIIDNPSG
jgi:uncharacterized protein (TIGR02246 family)